jgi:hypothetical protein
MNNGSRKDELKKDGGARRTTMKRTEEQLFT